MADYTAKKIDEMETIYGGAFFRARAALGATSFGLAIFDLPPNFAAYPEHDHSEDGQEEVYLALSGSAKVEIEGEEHTLDPSTAVRIAPGTNRKISTGEEGARILAIGGIPGKPYEAPKISELGEPDPLAA
jgi:uncharacterized cupin superfamily protein